MSLLSDRDIRTAIYSRHILVNPFMPECVQPSSLDVHLGLTILRQIATTKDWPLDVQADNDWAYAPVTYLLGAQVLLAPGELVLGSVYERLQLPQHIAARIEGKSSLGRLGVISHITAGFVDPGWDGHLTLEIKNMNPRHSVILYAGMKIAQLAFFELSSPAVESYSTARGSKYQGDDQPVGSRYYENFRQGRALLPPEHLRDDTLA